MMKKVILLSVMLMLLGSSAVFSEDAASDTGTEDEKKDTEEIISLNEERRETLRYGIDSELISLIAKLKEEKSVEFRLDIAEVYAETLNPEIMKSAVDYFISIDYEDAVPTAEKIIENWEDESYNTLSPALRYVSEFPGDDSEKYITKLLDHDNMSLASAALSAIGKCGTEASSDMLLDFLDDDEYPEELKPSVIKALGEIKSEAAVDTLIDILDDIDEEKSWRWTACEALGKIGDEEALPAIKNALVDKDTYLRSYAVKALSGFDSPEIEKTLIQALRDSFWRVRVAAAESLGEMKSSAAVDILIYKAGKDPEKNVKLAAVEALGEIGGGKSFDYLRELYSGTTTAQSVRTKAAEILIEKDLPATLDTIKTVLAEEWEKEISPVLSYTCKFLSMSKNGGLAGLFERMLNHDDVAIKIYGIRGAELNKTSELKKRIESLTEDGVNNAVRKAALSALEKL